MIFKGIIGMVRTRGEVSKYFAIKNYKTRTHGPHLQPQAIQDCMLRTCIRKKKKAKENCNTFLSKRVYNGILFVF